MNVLEAGEANAFIISLGSNIRLIGTSRTGYSIGP